MLAPSKTRESVGRRNRAPKSSTAPLAEQLSPCSCHTGLEGWAATAPGATELPLLWAAGEIITPWHGQEPVDFLAPGIVCWVPGGLLCLGDSLGLSSLCMLVQEALGFVPELSMFL